MGDSYKFTFIEYDLTRGYAEYLIRVQGPAGISFDFKDRYSQMLNFRDQICRDKAVERLKELPKFPSKKAFGSKKPQFLKQRQEQLQQVKQQEQLIMKYFKEKSKSNQDMQQIKQLEGHLLARKEGKCAPTSNISISKEEEKSQNIGVDGERLMPKGDGGIQPIITNSTLSCGQCVDMDFQNYQQNCQQIVAEIAAKFLDLGFNDNCDSVMYEEMRVKQDMFRKEFERFNFTFETQNLDLPTACGKSEEDLFNMEDEEFQRQQDNLGEDLMDLFTSLMVKQKEHYKTEGSVSDFS